jgi:hypothetical protein
MRGLFGYSSISRQRRRVIFRHRHGHRQSRRERDISNQFVSHFDLTCLDGPAAYWFRKGLRSP